MYQEAYLRGFNEQLEKMAAPGVKAPFRTRVKNMGIAAWGAPRRGDISGKGFRGAADFTQRKVGEGLAAPGGKAIAGGLGLGLLGGGGILAAGAPGRAIEEFRATPEYETVKGAIENVSGLSGHLGSAFGWAKDNPWKATGIGVGAVALPYILAKLMGGGRGQNPFPMPYYGGQGRRGGF